MQQENILNFHKIITILLQITGNVQFTGNDVIIIRIHCINPSYVNELF